MNSKPKPLMGSHRKANPLKAIKWLFQPKRTPKPFQLRTPNVRKRFKNPKALKGEMPKCGVVRLSFDIGIRNEIDAIAQTLKDRRNQRIRNPMKMGWGGQIAFSYYLNFFSEYSNFTVKEDKPQASPIPKTFDFLIGHKGESDTRFETIEVKTSPHGSRALNYYQAFNKEYPDYVVVVRCLKEDMTEYELYGWTSGSKVEAHEFKTAWNKKCHSMALNRTNFDYYSYFHERILGLPFKEKFGD